MRFDTEFDRLMSDEGGVSSSKYDNANIDGSVHTIYGITKKHYPEDFERIFGEYKKGNDVTELVKDFYKRNFWNDWYEVIESDEVVHKLFSFGVNASAQKAIKILQLTLSYFYGKNISIDGVIGNKTVQACNSISYQAPVASCFGFFICVDMFLNQFMSSVKKKVWNLLLNSRRDNDKHNIIGWVHRYLK